MGDNSKIQWTEATWNPIRARLVKDPSKVGWFCEKVSPECKNCYAEKMNEWRGNGIPYAVDQRKKVELYLDEQTLEAPLRWKRPRMIFPCSMTDLYGEFVPFEWIGKVYATMALAGALHGHTFQVLTKRPERRLQFLTKTDEGRGIAKEQYKHIWEGVSAGTQETANRWIPMLLATPAAVRWLSAEPLLEALDLKQCYGTELNWIVVGGESGSSARPCDRRWIYEILRAGKEAKVPMFVKQLGRLSHIDDNHRYMQLKDGKGGDISEWPDALRIREYPRHAI